jgi:dipeptidyl aminopeptidase/acylaminoacyl peptidase
VSEPATPAPADLDALQASVALMTKIGLCAFPSFSPDGARLAFISNMSGLPQVWTVATTGGWPEPATALDDSIYSVTWSPDGAWLAFALAPGGGMNQQIYLVHPDGTALRRLTDGGAENNWLGPWSYDGTKLAIASNRHAGSAMNVYLVDIATGEWRIAAEQNGIGEIVDISRDGRFAVLDRMVNRGDNNLILLDLNSHAETILTPHTSTATFGGGKFSPDGRIIYLSSDHGRDLAAFARLTRLPNGQPSEIEVLAARADAELDRFAVSADGTSAALVWNVAGRSELDFFDLANGKLSAGPKLPSELITHLMFSKDGRQLALTATGATAPYDVWLIDCASRRLTQVTHSPRELSPIHRLDRVKAATLVLHGANDTNVPVVEAEQVVAHLQQNDVPVEYILFPDEGHGFYKTANRIRSSMAVVRWFTRYLAPEPLDV